MKPCNDWKDNIDNLHDESLTLEDLDREIPTIEDPIIQALKAEETIKEIKITEALRGPTIPEEQ